jgi:hypothetical protein
VRGNVLIERHLIGAVAASPEAVSVARLIDRNAVNPGAQARLTAEAVNGTEDAQKDFLREVERFVPIAQQVHGELNDHALVVGNELCARGFLAGCTALHQCRLAAADVRPTGNSRLLHREFHYTKLDPTLA